ncbi:MAG: rhodanese-like domain-containing protein [Bacteroidetes bacterium]|nr:rhodanese-like domain-containing protein [Bacteroidota bacterium]MBP7398290.1 rhodanese-like domain-containing protein [Chitinophagales bacterium]MBK7108714.1 rhodanese-like domain-containing protein [Bacteroidota bacterium]MBK8488960.1 rhodanese-like domain-containing protein [Bacteroidota bacterium]MBK8680808.1 rhodanese-like domain-containing protein [Bacteroidota bacterium]
MFQLSIAEFEKWKTENRKFFLVDVREEEEHEKKNIGGVLIPLGEIVLEKNKIPKDIPVIFYCRKGIRSQLAIQRLKQMEQYTNLYNLTGGIGD